MCLSGVKNPDRVLARRQEHHVKDQHYKLFYPVGPKRIEIGKSYSLEDNVDKESPGKVFEDSFHPPTDECTAIAAETIKSTVTNHC